MNQLRLDLLMTAMLSLPLASCEPPGADEFLAGEVAAAQADTALAAAHNCGADAVRTLPSNADKVNVWVTEPVSSETLNCVAEWFEEGPR